MPDDPSEFDPQTLWQSQAQEYDPMTLAQIHDGASVFQSKIRRRNLIEYVACVVVVVGFTPALLNRQSWLMQLGAGWMMLAAVFVAWQLHRRGSAQVVPDASEALVQSVRHELARQRDALRTVGTWYLAPFLPGFALIMLGRWFQSHAAHRPLDADHMAIAFVCVILVLFFLIVWLLNQRGADQLQRRIDDFDRTVGK